MDTQIKTSDQSSKRAIAHAAKQEPCKVVDRGPNWLIIRVHTEALTCSPRLADRLWSIASRHLVYRLVLELDGLASLESETIAELVCLKEQLSEHEGALRLCGLRPKCAEALRASEERGALHNQPDRHAAVGDSWCGGPADYLRSDASEPAKPEKEPDYSAREEKPRLPLPNKPR